MQKVAWWVAVAPLFLILLVPFYVANESFFPFITGKGFLFRILVEISLVGWLVLAAYDKRYRPRFSPLIAIYAAFTTWMFIANLFAINAHKAFWSNFERMDGFVTLIHVFLFFVILGAVFTEDLWKKWWWTFIATSALICGYALLQLGGGLAIHQSGVRLDATFGNAIYLAAYLLFAIAITVWFAFTNTGFTRYALLALAALQTLILFNTATRGAIVALVGAALTVAFLFFIRSGTNARKIALGGLVALVLLVGGFWLAKDSAWVTGNPVLSRIATISLSELEVRFTLWSMAAEGIKERPLVGYGQEGYNYIFNEYYRPSLFAQEPWFDRAHSAYMDWLVAGGIPAFLLFLALLIATMVILLRAKNLGTSERILLFGALTAYALQAIVVFDNLFSYVPLAAVLAYVHFRTAKPLGLMERAPVLSRGQFEAVLIPVAGALLLFLILTVNLPNMRAATHLVYAISPLQGGPAENLERFRAALSTGTYATQEIREQLISYTAQVLSQPIPDALKNEYASLASTEIEKEVVLAPEDARTRMQAALLYRVFGDYPRALAHIEAAAAVSPDRQLIMLEHATILAQMGKKEEAVALFERTYALSPQFPELGVRTAAGLIVAGEQERADKLLVEAMGTTVVNNDALVNAYLITKDYTRLIAILTLAVEEQPGSPDAHYRLASGYALAGRLPEARTTIQTAMTKFPQTIEQGRAFLTSLSPKP